MAVQDQPLYEAGDATNPPLILLHALGLGNWMWLPQLPLFAASYHVLAPRLLGTDGTSPFTFEHAATALADLIQAQNCGPAHICGLSLGAITALQLYQQAPETVASLTLSGCQVHPNPVLMGIQELVMRILPERQLISSVPAFFRKQYPELVELGVAEGSRLGKKGLIHTARAIGQIDFRRLLPTITVPTLVLCGGNDRPNLPAAHQLSTHIPQAQLRIVPNVGHVWSLEQPKTFAHMVLEFLHQTRS